MKRVKLTKHGLSQKKSDTKLSLICMPPYVRMIFILCFFTGRTFHIMDVLKFVVLRARLFKPWVT